MIIPNSKIADALKGEVALEYQPTMMPGQPITPTKFAELSRRFFPTPGQVAFMLEHLTINKRIPRLMLAELLGVTYEKIEKIKSNPDAATRSAVRLLWCLYQIDVQPQCLIDMFHWATWGQIDVELPAKRTLTRNEVTKVTNILKRFKEQGMYAGLPTVIEMVQKECGVLLMNRRAWKLCQQVGLSYKKSDALVSDGSAAFGRRFGPHSPYMNMDWRKSNPELGRQFGMRKETVEKVRAELTAIDPKRLAQYLKACGKNPEFFEPILLKEKTKSE